MHRRRLASFALALAAAAPLAGAQTYPTKPIRFIVNTAPGGSTDLVTRIVAQHMSDQLGQTIVVDNRAGADGLIGIRAARSAAADGYTILAATGTLLVQPLLKSDAGYHPLKDFNGIGLIARSPLLLMVGGDQPDRSFSDFVARAKANPGKLTYASAGIGTLTHLPLALIVQQANLQLQHIPYKGTGPAFADVGAGRVTAVMTAYTSGLPHLQSGKMRPIGVSSTARLAALPNLPTLSEQGLAGYSFYTWYALLAPAGTPNAAIQKLAEALRTTQGNKDLAERFRIDGSEITPMTPGEFGGYLKQEAAKLDKLVTDLGLTKK